MSTDTTPKRSCYTYPVSEQEHCSYLSFDCRQRMDRLLGFGWEHRHKMVTTLLPISFAQPPVFRVVANISLLYCRSLLYLFFVLRSSPQITIFSQFVVYNVAQKSEIHINFVPFGICGGLCWPRKKIFFFR